jgi:diguanylate cyclase (GGDEF)-like protein/putative nucleotidyltransferase with HDIG domain
MLASIQAELQRLLPSPSQVTTTAQRERYRKAHLLAVVICAELLLVTIPLLNYLFANELSRMLILLAAMGVLAGALELNRRGYMEWAAAIFILLFLGVVLFFTALDHVHNGSDLWICFLALPSLLAGFFLPLWAPLALGGVNMVLLTCFWFLPEIFTSFALSTINTIYFVSFYFFFATVALIGALYAWSLNHAVSQADRADELEFLNRRLAELHEDVQLKNQHLQEANEELQVLQSELFSNNFALKAVNTRLQSMATVDTMTGVPNHRAIALTLQREVEAARRHDRPLTLLFCDIDHFKAINDTYGHSAGDVILRAFAQQVHTTLRHIDAVGRWGGEEFVVILPGVDEVGALPIAERIRATVAAHAFPATEPLQLTCSIGVATFPSDAQDQQTLIDAADRAMYAAKHGGRNQVRRASEPLVAAQLHGVNSAVISESVGALVALLEARDAYTGEHTQTVGKIMEEVAREMGCSAAEVQEIGLAGRLHDLGKVATPDAILYKPATLTEEEWEVMQRHPLIGAEIISRFPGLAHLAPIIRSHHERWDGRGYPDRLAGADIPLGGRIAAVVDTFDAMTTDRPYLPARPVEQAIVELQRCVGAQFDPTVVAAFLRVLDRQGVAPLAA